MSRARIERTFLALIGLQAAHSIEEYSTRFYVLFPPARALARTLPLATIRFGFVVVNGLLFAFGLWCYLVPIRRRWPVWQGWAWLWVAIEVFNGIAHPLWGLTAGGYVPGLVTAPALLFVALLLAASLAGDERPAHLPA